ncbi:Imm61 family immunity protein [Buchananella felis]|uniref:Imm61 family immunity protein n=1 Tax=Buchananella felis TaxID=3231492 RepID=UPI0035279895
MVEFAFSNTFISLVTSSQIKGRIVEHDDRYEIVTPVSATHVVKLEDGEYCLGSYERADPPSFTLYTTDLALAERYVVSALCDDHREDLHFPSLDFYTMARKIKPGFEAFMIKEHYSTLRDTHTGNSYPIRIYEFSDRPLKATRLSHSLTVPIEELFAAYLDPNGAPLFSEFIEKRPPR